MVGDSPCDWAGTVLCACVHDCAVAAGQDFIGVSRTHEIAGRVFEEWFYGSWDSEIGFTESLADNLGIRAEGSGSFHSCTDIYRAGGESRDVTVSLSTHLSVASSGLLPLE